MVVLQVRSYITKFVILIYNSDAYSEARKQAGFKMNIS